MTEPIAEVGWLAGLCGSEDGTDWEKVLIDASRRLVVAVASAMAQECQLYGWDGDSWEKLQVDSNKYLKVTLPIEEALGARAYQYDGTTWRRSNLLWGYNDTVSETVQNLALTEGNNTLTSTQVPDDEVWVISTASVRADGGPFTDIRCYLDVDGEAAYIIYQTTPTSTLWYFVTGQFVLGPGDYIKCLIVGAQADDAGYLRYAGYKMKIDM